VLLVTIPGTSFKLDTGAQASLMRMVPAGMPLQITTAYRDREYQQRLRDLYLAGRGSYALPPGRSLHEQGLAVDFGWSASAWLDFHAARYGWARPNGWNAPGVKNPEWWHWEYNVLRDTQLFAHPNITSEDDEMDAAQAKKFDEMHWMLNRIRTADLPDLRDNEGKRVWGYKNPDVPTGDKDAYWHQLNPSSSAATVDVQALAVEVAKLIPATTVDEDAIAQKVADVIFARMKE